MTWWAIFALAAGTYVAKAAGPIALGSRVVPPPLQRALTLLSVTLLAGLVAISTFGHGRALALDARAAGLAVALGAVWLRAPFAVVVVAATATAAGLRLVGIG
jgi:branched-subunit amino acid transport protein